jgi:hypothetical protein
MFPPKYRYPPTKLHDVATQDRMLSSLLESPVSVKTLDLILNKYHNKLHLFSLTQNRFFKFILLPLHVCYTFRPVLGPSSGMAIEKNLRG